MRGLALEVEIQVYAATKSDPSHNIAIGCSKVIVFCRPQFDNSLDCAQCGKTHITVRSHECPTSLMLARRVETSLTHGVKGHFWSCLAARDVIILVYRGVRHGVGILFESCSNFDRLSITGGPLMSVTISIGYIKVIKIKASAVDWHTGGIRWSQSVRCKLSRQIEMGRFVKCMLTSILRVVGESNA